MSDPKQLPAARVVAEWLQALDPDDIPQAVQRACTHTLIDTLGLSIAARHTDYVAALRSAWPSPGPCTVLGCADTREMTGAEMINGTAAHGEDFDTPYEERLAAIEAAIERLVRDHGSSDVTVAIQAAAPLLTDRINALVEAVAERQREHAQDAVARAAQAVFDAVHAARDALVLTSIFIDPGSAEMIRFYKGRNPRHHGLIGAYYDRFL